jgi:hypothetical protein
MTLDATRGITDYKNIVLYEKFCTYCGESGHNADTCGVHKVVLCKYWNKKGCLNISCPFAHGTWELRYPKKSHCAKVFEIAPKTYVVRGCGEKNTHTFENCPKQGLIWPPPRTESKKYNE